MHYSQRYDELSPERLYVISECMENYDVGDPEAEWPHNVISRHAVVYGSGVIARKGEIIRHEVDQNELELCQRLSIEIATLMVGVRVMTSAADDEFHNFFIAGIVGETPPVTIDETLIRCRFAGTISRIAQITVEPLSEQGIWWSEVVFDAESDETALARWRRMIRWFQERPEFITTAFVRIGNDESMWNTPEEEWPEGAELTGCVFPRLALGLTKGGSLVGLFGHSVQA